MLPIIGWKRECFQNQDYGSDTVQAQDENRQGVVKHLRPVTDTDSDHQERQQ